MTPVLLLALAAAPGAGLVMVLPPAAGGDVESAWVAEAVADSLPRELAVLGVPVLDRDDLKRQLDAAYKRGLSAGLDGLRAASESLKGTGALTSKEEIALTVNQEVRAMTPEQRNAEIVTLLKQVRDDQP